MQKMQNADDLLLFTTLLHYITLQLYYILLHNTRNMKQRDEMRKKHTYFQSSFYKKLFLRLFVNCYYLY